MSEKKQIIVAIGNCQSDELSYGLSQMPTINENFEVYALQLHLTPIPEQPMLDLLRRSRFVFVQAISEAQQLKALDDLPPGCERFSFPFLRLRAAWPFDTFFYGRDEIARKNADGGPPFPFQDGLLSQLRSRIPDKGERFKVYEELHVEGIPSAEDIAAFELAQIQGLDHKFGGKIGEFILDNYRDKQIFHSLSHPSGELLQKLCEHAWKQMSMHGSCPDVSEALDGWKTVQAPVHPRIGRTLGLRWATEETRYLCGQLGSMTWEQWATSYIERFG